MKNGKGKHAEVKLKLHLVSCCLQKEERSSNGSKDQRHTRSESGSRVWWDEVGAGGSTASGSSGSGGLESGWGRWRSSLGWENAAGRATVSSGVLAGRQVGLGLGGTRCEVCEGPFSGWVDGANHAGLTMFTLRAVEPDWLIVLNSDSECWHNFSRLSDWHEAREKANSTVASWGVFNWNTWVGKRSPDNRVIQWMELELNEITNCGLDLCGFENWLSIPVQSLNDMYLNLVGLGRNEGGEGGKSNESLGEEHFGFDVFM